MNKEKFMSTDFSFDPIETKRASEIVYEQIREAILSGELKSGDKLPSERRLVELYERSHATIREALRMLESNGYIEVAPGGRTTIKEISLQSAVQPLQDMVVFRNISVSEIIEFFSSIEHASIKQAVEKSTSEQIDEIHKAYDAMVSSKEEVVAFFDAVLMFHSAALKATNSVLIEIIWKSVGTQIYAFDEYEISLYSLFTSRESRLALLEAHRALLGAIYAKNGDKAAELIEKCWPQINS